MTIGTLILVALVLYQGPELIARMRSAGLAFGRRVRVRTPAEAATGGGD
jgi:hypothetical protein